jgi:HPt (histidine-containing phosphotransfer) domain-containing protein
MTAARTRHPVRSAYAADADFAELLDAFHERLPLIRSELLDAMERCNSSDLAVYAHRLKGAAGGYGYPELSTIAGALEQHAKDNSPEVTSTFERLLFELQCVADGHASQ